MDNAVVTDDGNGNVAVREVRRRRRSAANVGRFYRNEQGRVFILAQIDKNSVVLISLEDGSAWTRPMTVNSMEFITKEEWGRICDEKNFFRQ